MWIRKSWNEIIRCSPKTFLYLSYLLVSIRISFFFFYFSHSSQPVHFAFFSGPYGTLKVPFPQTKKMRISIPLSLNSKIPTEIICLTALVWVAHTLIGVTITKSQGHTMHNSFQSLPVDEGQQLKVVSGTRAASSQRFCVEHIFQYRCRN